MSDGITTTSRDYDGQVPFGRTGKWEETIAVERRPETPLQALMETIPGDEPDSSQIELLALRDLLADTLEEVLTDSELYVFNALVVERLSVRQLEKRISIPKSTIHRYHQQALKKLREALADHPLVAARLHS